MLDYKIISRKISPVDGMESTVVAYNGSAYRINGTRGMDEIHLCVQLYNELIRKEPSIAKKQEIARERHEFTTGLGF